jgi:putative transposase
MSDNVLPPQNPGSNDNDISPLDALVREGARRMLQAALDNEVEEVIARFANVVDTEGRRVVVRNGHLPERELVTGAGPLKVKQPRVRDRSGEYKFTSKILPPFLRRTPSIDALIPVLYLKGVSTGDFSEALSAILGPNARSEEHTSELQST